SLQRRGGFPGGSPGSDDQRRPALRPEALVRRRRSRSGANLVRPPRPLLRDRLRGGDQGTAPVGPGGVRRGQERQGGIRRVCAGSDPASELRGGDRSGQKGGGLVRENHAFCPPKTFSGGRMILKRTRPGAGFQRGGCRQSRSPKKVPGIFFSPRRRKVAAR